MDTKYARETLEYFFMDKDELVALEGAWAGFHDLLAELGASQLECADCDTCKK